MASSIFLILYVISKGTVVVCYSVVLAVLIVASPMFVKLYVISTKGEFNFSRSSSSGSITSGQLNIREMYVIIVNPFIQ